MAKFETAESAVRLEKIRRLFRLKNRTVTEVAGHLKVSKQLAQHYMKGLSDMGEIKIVGTQPVGRCNANANVWALTNNPKKQPQKHDPKKAKIINPPRRDVQTLTNWIGGNPFERLTA